MCLVTSSPKQIAKQPIIVYKCLQEDLVSPCYNFQYEIGKTYESKLGIEDKIPTTIINEGFHCYTRLVLAKAFLKVSWWDKTVAHLIVHYTSRIVKCEIPVGSEYYTDGSEIVSNKLKILEICV